MLLSELRSPLYAFFKGFLSGILPSKCRRIARIRSRDNDEIRVTPRFDGGHDSLKVRLHVHHVLPSELTASLGFMTVSKKFQEGLLTDVRKV